IGISARPQESSRSKFESNEILVPRWVVPFIEVHSLSEQFQFHPESFVLPRDVKELQQFCKDNRDSFLIIKEPNFSEGRGTVLLHSLQVLSGLEQTNDTETKEEELKELKDIKLKL